MAKHEEDRAPLLFEVRLNHLVPANEYSADILADLPWRTLVVANVPKRPPPAEVIYAWSTCRKIVKHTDCGYHSDVALMDALKIAFDHVRITRLIGRPDKGEVQVATVPRSLMEMSQEKLIEFTRFLDLKIETEICPGLNLARFLKDKQ